MSNDTILREVDEELRSDRVRNFWKRFGPYVIGAAVAVVLLVAVNEGWAWWQGSNSARSSDEFYTALQLADGTDVAAAQKALDQVIADGHGGYPSLARFRAAALLAKDGKTAEAVAAYDALSTSETNTHLRDLALVLAAYLLVDGGDVAAVEQRVGGLVSPANSLRNAAREAIGLAKYAAGDLPGARQSFQDALTDPLAAQEARNRLQIYIGQLAAEGAPDPAAAAAAPAADAAAAAPSVGDAPALDVTAPAPAADTAPAATAPAADPAATTPAPAAN